MQVAPGEQDPCVGPEQLRSMNWGSGAGVENGMKEPCKIFLSQFKAQQYIS